MRRSVVVIASGLFVVAAALLMPGTQRAPVASTPEAGRDTTRPGTTPPVTPLAASMRLTSDRLAVASTDVPRSAIDRYLSADRLFDVYEQLRRNAHGADLWVAERIAFDCRLTFRESSLIGAALAGRPLSLYEKVGPGTRAGPQAGEVGSLRVTQVIATPAQVDAARELRRRCDGFQSMTWAMYRASLADIDDRLWHIDDAVGLASSVAAHRMPATPERLRSILASRDPVAITLLDEELGQRWLRSSGQPVVQALWGAPSPAMQLVACDLEADCSPTSRTALFGCIDDAEGCGLDVHHQLMRFETPPTQQLIADAHAAYVHAIVSGDYAVWGL